MTLVVSQNNRRVGLLVGTADRGVVFFYDPHYLADGNARAISHSLPLQEQEFSSKQCLPFFSGLLPDGEMRRRISEYLHVSESSTLRLLEALGRECAGSVVLLDEETDGQHENLLYSVHGTYRKVDEHELATMIRHMDIRPLLIGSSDFRLSLAGAQQKMALARFFGDWYVPLEGAATSHILKPSHAPFQDLAVNEYLCMQLAKLCALPVAATDLVVVEDIPVFVAERYDRRRVSENPPVIERIPQEDACQALGIMPDRKYEEDGGPGLGQLASLVQKLSKTPILELQKLLRLAVFNFLIGNCDAHAKNVSFVYDGENPSGTLAPFYDLVSTRYYEQLSAKLSMRIGGEYRIDSIRREHFLALAQQLGVGKGYMASLLKEMSELVMQGLEVLTVPLDAKYWGPMLALLRQQAMGRVQQIRM